MSVGENQINDVVNREIGGFRSVVGRYQPEFSTTSDPLAGGG